MFSYSWSGTVPHTDDFIVINEIEQAGKTALKFLYAVFIFKKGVYVYIYTEKKYIRDTVKPLPQLENQYFYLT